MSSDRTQPSAAGVPWRTLLLAAAFQYAAYMVMQTLALFAETRRGPVIPDLLHALIPARTEFYWINSVFWLPVLLISILILAFTKPYVCLNYLRMGAVLSLLRGVFIPLTSLGPSDTLIHSAPRQMLALTTNDITLPVLIHQWFPGDVFFGGSGLSAAYLTQDMFFSGHTSTTFLLVICVLRERANIGLSRALVAGFLLFHVITVAGLLLTHEHYTIDILAAYVFVYAVWKFFEARGWLVGAATSS